MRTWFLALLTGLLVTVFPPGPRAQAGQGDGIEAVIERQMEAFARDDFTRAFEFASPTIRSIFRTPGNFGRMVRRGYPMVWHNDEVDFLELREIDGALWQKVMVRDTDGARHVLDYRMIRQGGEWRIDAVRRVPEPDVAV